MTTPDTSTPAAEVVTPEARLARSRARLRLALMQIHAEHAQADAARASGPAWWAKLRSDPGTRLVLDAASTWWAQQPWHKASSVLAASVQQALRPLAQKYPFALVLAAAAAGSLVMLLRPWRWLSVPALAAGLIPALLAKVMGLLQPIPWSEVISNWLKKHTADSTPSDPR